MKKIIAAIDALHFSEEELDSFQYIAREAKGKLTAVFLENIIGQGIPAPTIFPEGSYLNFGQMVLESQEERRKLTKENIERLIRICEKNDIDIKLHEATGSPVQEVITESRFADLLLINNNTSFAFLYETNPPEFVKDVLAKAQCPVMVLPERMAPIKEIIFAYNGTFSSMYAIRQFTQLFPELSDMPVNVVYVAEGNSNIIPKEKLLKEYLEHHYDEVKYTVLNGEPTAEFLALLLHRKDCIITYGAYGRSGLSRFFHHSDAESILRTINIPVFITHP